MPTDSDIAFVVVMHQPAQRTHEELESAKEELQSLNEELQTVNAELQSKVKTLSSTNDDMENLLNSTDIATIFLDSHLCIKRFTPLSNEIFHLIQSGIGRPLNDLTSSLNHERLVRDAQEVLRTLESKDQEMQTQTNVWYLMRMRPYRTSRNVIDGVVITFVDITRLQQAEEARQIAETAARRYAENIVQAIRQPLMILDAELRVVLANQSFYELFRLTLKQPRNSFSTNRDMANGTFLNYASGSATSYHATLSLKELRSRVICRASGVAACASTLTACRSRERRI
jgi:two-component system CheB/CheR fusion protein